MTTSGAASFNMDLNEIVEEAMARCGAEMRTGWDLRTARNSLNLMLIDWASRGINLWCIEQGSQVLTPGTNTYTLPADTVDLLEHVIRTGAGNVSTQTDLTITRISVSTYSSIPNKLQSARPIQIWINRQGPAPQFTVWPTPDNSQTYTLVYWRLRRMQDAGAGGTYTQDIPFRFLNALVAGLAYYLALKIPGADVRLPVLKEQYDQAWDLASSEDRDRSAVRFVPRQYFLS